MNNPRFRRDFRVEIVDPDTVFLLSERTHHVLTGRLYVLIAPLLNGQHSLEAITTALSSEVSSAQLRYTLNRLRRQGVLAPDIDTFSDLPPEQAAYWDAQQIAAEPRQQATVRVLGEPYRGDLIEILQTLAFCIVENHADLTVVISEDYLDPALAKINRAMIETKESWLLLKPSGTVLWVGPLFTVGGACWQCLAQRLHGNRPVEAFIQHNTSATAPLTPPLAALPSTVNLALNLAATAAAQWLASGQSVLKDTLLTLDPITLQTEHHPVVKRPQCPVCGDPRPRIPEPISLTSHPKIAGAARSETPSTTYARYSHHVSRITGAVSLLERVPSLGAFYVYAAGPNKSRPYDSWQGMRHSLRSHNAGKGLDEMQAKVSGLCEALERGSGAYEGDEAREAAKFSAQRGNMIHPNDLLLYSDHQYAERDSWNADCPPHLYVPELFDVDQIIDWTPIWSLTENTFKLVPTAYCYYGYRPPESFCTPDSNGSAAGSSLEDAILQGFMELVERDAIAIWWYNRLRLPAVDLDEIDHPYLQEARRFYAAHQRELWVLNLTTDLNIPACVAVSRRIDKPAEDIIMGFGAHFDPQVAVLRALTELNQMLPSVLALDSIGHYYSESRWETDWWQTATVANQTYLAPNSDLPPAKLSSFSRFDGADLRDDVLACIEITRRHRLEMLVLDQTRPDLGLPVVKVIVPGLRHFWNRFAPGRLYDVPLELGWLTSPTPEADLNPNPMTL